VPKSGFSVLEISKNSPTSTCTSKKFCRLASAGHKAKGRDGEGRVEKREGKREKGGEAAELTPKHKT
jgi:hypothetical protein